MRVRHDLLGLLAHVVVSVELVAIAVVRKRLMHVSAHPLAHPGPRWAARIGALSALRSATPEARQHELRASLDM